MTKPQRTALLLGILGLTTLATSYADELPPVSERARKVHAEGMLFDGHNDLPWRLRADGDMAFETLDIARRLPSGQTDIPRLREGGLKAQFWSVYIPSEHPNPARTVTDQIDLVHRMVERYPNDLEMAYTADDVERIVKSGKIASLIGIEGGVAIEDDLAQLRMFARLGARYMTLTHNKTLDWADAANDKPLHDGLTPFGERVVKEMNRVGMLVDISHVSPACMLDVLKVSESPIIASHSSARAIADHPRNVPDDVLKLMPKNGGVIMVNFYSGFIVPAAIKQGVESRKELQAKFPDPKEFQKALRDYNKTHPMPRGTVKDVVDHIEHIAKVAGIDHVGIGSDYDGVNSVPVGLEDVSCYPRITEELLNRGYSEGDIHKILGGNALRAFRKSGKSPLGSRRRRGPRSISPNPKKTENVQMSGGWIAAKPTMDGYRSWWVALRCTHPTFEGFIVMRFGLALFLLLTPGLALAQKSPVPDLPIESYVLPNGLKVVLHRDPSVPRVTVCVAYHVGSKNESAGRTGFAHFFEHMMFRGTKNVPNYDIPLQETGAQSNAFTSEDLTVYFETVPAAFLDRALYLEAERLAFLPTALEQEKFATEREVVKNERRQSIDNVPYGLSEESLLAKVFPKGHPYSWSVIGSMKDLDAATLKDLTRFFVEFYHPGNASLCLAGDFDPAQAKASIARYFDPIPAGPAIKAVVANTPPLTQTITLSEKDKVTLPRLYWAWPGVGEDDPDAAALDLLAAVLDGEAGRLHNALVRDARVATEVETASDTKEIAGLFTIDATAAEGKTLDQVTTALNAAMADLAAHPATAKELARALAKFETGTFGSLTSPLRRAITLSTSFVKKGNPKHYREEYARYYKVTTADLARVAKKYLTPDKVILSIVPAKPGEDKGAPEQVGPLPGPASDVVANPRLPRTGPTAPDWSIMPGPAASPDWQAPRYVRKTLSNGMDLWVVPWKTLPIVQASLVIPVGTADDPAGKAGLASLTATLLGKGTKTKTDTELSEAFEELGVTLSTGAGVDSTAVGFSVLARNLKPALTLVGEVLTAPRFDPKDFDRERKLQLEGLLQGKDNAAWIAQRAFRAVLFGADHPYGSPGAGYEGSVKGLTLDDVKAFDARYAANRTKLIVVGDVDPDTLVADLEMTLGAWKTTGPEPKPRAVAAPKGEPGVVYLVDKPGAVQSVIGVGRRWVDRKDPRYFATLVGNHIVGADFLSRLNANLREKNGYSYGIGSAFNYRRTGSVWQISSSVRADVTAEALKEVVGELDALPRTRPLTDEEITIARDAEARTFSEDFEDPRGIAGVLAGIAQFDLPANYLETYLKDLQGTPDALIRKVMDEVVAPSARTILIVGDRASVEPRLKKLGFNDIRIVDQDGKPVVVEKK